MAQSGSYFYATGNPSNETANSRGPALLYYSASNSSSFVGDDWSIIIGPLDVQRWSNIALTVVNNHGTNKLESGSVEFSANGTQWEDDWDVATFAGLGVGNVRSMQIAGNSRKFLRVRAIPSGSDGALTGSTDVIVHLNNG